MRVTFKANHQDDARVSLSAFAFDLHPGGPGSKCDAGARIGRQSSVLSSGLSSVLPSVFSPILPPLFAAIMAGAISGSSSPVFAEKIESALAKAYGLNPTLNAQRASTRATDENVPQAKASGRPTISLSVDGGPQENDGKSKSFTSSASGFGGGKYSLVTFPRGAAATVTQTIYNGNKTENSTRQAESQVLGARETLRNTEQQVLLQGATAYMNVLRDTAILNLRRNNVEVLEEQLRQTNDRFRVGEVTRTDVAQAQSRLAASRSDAILAESNLKTSLGVYRQQIGEEPKQLSAARPVEFLLPNTREQAVSISQAEHPAILGALHGVDAQLLQVKVIEADLYPNLSVQGNVQDRIDTTAVGSAAFSASVVGRLTVPIYEGGLTYSRVRQAKETLGQTQITVDVQRDAVRAAVIQTWGQLEASKAQIVASQSQVRASEVALNGVREEAKVGQRTTLDVLNAQQELLNARVSLISAQRDRIVNSYNVLSAIGRLDSITLTLKVAPYTPVVHYRQVKDKWIGLRTPDER